MITEETLNALIDMMHEAYPVLDTLTFHMSPTMHRRLYMLNGLSRLNNHSTRKLRKVHLRKIAARRQSARKRLERQYNEKYTSVYEQSGIDYLAQRTV